MSHVVRDRQRSAVYAAEASAFTHTLADEPIGLRAVQTLAGTLFAHPWWREAALGIVPTVTAARAGARQSSASLTKRGWTIRLAQTVHLDATTLAHEAAHVALGVRVAELRPGPEGLVAHGPEFRAAHLDVAEVVLGRHGRGLLAEAYAGAGLSIGALPREWPQVGTWPPLDREHGLLGCWRSAIAL